LGEGCDGGSIPTRIELVRVKQQPEQASVSDTAHARSRYCSLSNDILTAPIVVCVLGRMYNKVAVIEALLNKQLADKPDCCHIQSLKDVREAKLTPNPQFSVEGGGSEVCPFLCPITKVELDGKHAFVLLKSCSHVVSEKALKETNATTCPVCEQIFDKNEQTIPLNPDHDTLETLKAKLQQRKSDEAKTKKRKKKEKKTEPSKKTKLTEAPLHKPTPLASVPQPQYAKSAVYQSIFRKKSCGDDLSELTFTSTAVKDNLGLK